MLVIRGVPESVRVSPPRVGNCRRGILPVQVRLSQHPLLSTDAVGTLIFLRLPNCHLQNPEYIRLLLSLSTSFAPDADLL